MKFHSNLKIIILMLAILAFSGLSGCISPDNKVIEGLGTPDVTECSTIAGVGDGAEYNPREATQLDLDSDSVDDPVIHPDIFYIGWSTLDVRSDLRFPEQGYSGDSTFEDKLFVSRQTLGEQQEPTIRTWQLLPQLGSDCQDIEKIRIHSFDVAPNGRSLYISMARTPTDGGIRDENLAIYRFDFKNYTLTKISADDSVSFTYPTYMGNDPSSGHEILLVSKTVQKIELPINYAVPQKAVLQDEYDRAATPLIHKMDAVTGDTVRIGFNNSHQTEPFTMDDPDGNPIIGFTQWEHQQSVNRFALWKMQIDGSDNFTLYGEEAETNDSIGDIYQGREIKTGAYAGYIIMGEGNRSSASFPAEGNILMTKRKHLDLRSDKIYLQKVEAVGSDDTHIARSPEHYNEESFVYSYRADSGKSYNIYIKDFPINLTDDVTGIVGKQISPVTTSYHFVQARSFYLPKRQKVVPTEGDLGQNRVSFTNTNLNGKSGFLVENITQSDNGEQHQIDGIDPSEIALQFFVPSHHFSDSYAVGLESSQEMNIPASGFISPESDGSIGVVLKNGLYMWKMNKRFDYNGENIWLPIRAERQEISFVPDRVNACNQCHQNRDQINLDKYANYSSIAATKMRGNLSDVADITTFDTYDAIPNFHENVVPLLTKASLTAVEGKFYTCIDCHRAGTKLNLSNFSGPDVQNSTYRNAVLGASKLDANTNINYLNGGINPMGTENGYNFAPLFWSVLLNNDLSVPSDDTHPNSASRSLERAGDYGATYSEAVNTKIAAINAQYDHSKHWSKSDMQAFIIYSNTRLPAVLSDDNNFVVQGSGYRSSSAGQKAYQAMLRNCFNCHNSFTGSGGEGIEDARFGLPEEKVFSSDTGQRDKRLRFMIRNHVATKDATVFSNSTDISDLNTAMDQTLLSATYRIDFNQPEQSELLLYALGKDKLNSDGTVANDAQNLLTTEPHYVRHNAVLLDNSPDYLAIKNWVMNTTEGIVNQPPEVDANQKALTINEYDDPDYLLEEIRWSDPDSDLSQLFLEGSSTTEHSFNDTMLALNYLTFTSAQLKTYAIFGDRGNQNFRFVASDGQASASSLEFPVTVSEGIYSVQTPSSILPSAYAYYTVTSGTGDGTCADGVNDVGELHKLTVKADDLTTTDIDESLLEDDICIGIIAGYSTNWTTVYRRSDRGWLYFMDQAAQKIHVVNENNARVLFTVQLDHSDNKENDLHKQTQYLLWWRLADGIDYSSDDRWTGSDGVAYTSDVACSSGELQGVLESKLSETLDGDWYVGLGCDESMLDTVNSIALSTLTVATAEGVDNNGSTVKVGDLLDSTGTLMITQSYQVRPRYRQRLIETDLLSGYVWKRATFMTKIVQDGIDRFNVLNLFTGKDKSFGDFTYTTVDNNGVAIDLDSDGIDDTVSYFNVRAVVVAEDGAFYGFNKDLNQNAKIFNFDPIKKTQTEITNLPPWISSYLDNIGTYGTPFLMIEPRP